MIWKDSNTIVKLSPSKIGHVSECKLRYTYSLKSSQSSGKKEFNRFSFLGILIHSVLEAFVKDNLPINLFEEIWQKTFQDQMQEYNLPNIEMNLLYELPYYIIKKNQFRQILETLEFRGYDKMEPEARVEGRYVKGIVDLLEEDKVGRTILLTDLKTGPIWDIQNGFIINVKDAYRLQLLTYGLTFWEKGYSAENIVCCLRGLGIDEKIEMTFQNEDYNKHQLFLHKLLEEINNSAASADLHRLASPSNKACSNCDYNDSCLSLHRKLKFGVEHFPSLSLIEENNSEFNSDIKSISVRFAGGTYRIDGIPIEEFTHMSSIVQSGKSLLITGLFAPKVASNRRWTKYSIYSQIDKTN